MFTTLRLLSCIAAVCLCLSVPVFSQTPESPSGGEAKAVTLEEAIDRLKTLLDGMGYRDIRLSVQDKSIAGTATKDGREVRILLDGNGLLHIE